MENIPMETFRDDSIPDDIKPPPRPPGIQMVSSVERHGPLWLPENKEKEMSLRQMKELPHLIKPLALLLIILQLIFVFIPAKHGFFWFVILTTILMLILIVAMFAVFFADFTPVTEAPHWWLAETIIAMTFVVFNGVNFFYFIVNMFKHFNFLFIILLGLSVLQFLVWAFDAFYWFKNRIVSSSATTSNQATATPAPHPAWPAGANPA